MPITPAHAVAAWPLHRALRRLPLSALLIGTLAPDLEYVLNLRPEGRFGHTPQGLVLFCLPLTLLLWWTWRWGIAPALLPLLPAGPRLAAQRPPPGRATDQLPLAVVAALLGALSHVFWDGFTHLTGWGVVLIPWLTRPLLPGSPLKGYSLAQYLSSALGGLGLGVWAAVAYRRFPAAARVPLPGQRAAMGRLVLFLLLASAAGAWLNGRRETTLNLVLGRAAVGAELGFALGLLVFALVVRWGKHRAMQRTE